MRTPSTQAGGFLVGLAWGLSTSAAVFLLLLLLWPGHDLFAGLSGSFAHAAILGRDLVSENLQGSVLPFTLVLVAWFAQLLHLEKLLSAAEPPMDRILRHEQLLDLCANLFFGIGVIWTAIGMRDALIHGLGSGAFGGLNGPPGGGAFAVLQRLVDGGILLALSTTIVGGIGGYLMRVLKSVALGSRLAALYLRESRRPAEAELATLQRIEALLQKPDRSSEPW